MGAGTNIIKRVKNRPVKIIAVFDKKEQTCLFNTLFRVFN